MTAVGSDAAEAAWYRFLHATGLPESSFDQGVFEAGFKAGAKFAVVTTSQMSPHIATLADLLAWLREQDTEP